MALRFEEIVSEDLYNACWRYCCRLSSSRQDAEDLLQEALVRAYLALGQLKDAERTKGWLFSIIRRAHIDRLRSRHSRPKTIADGSGVDPAADRQPDPKPGPAGKSSALEAALVSLPRQQRELIELYHLEGLSLEETAQALGIRVGAVKQRLLRAREALKRRLAPAFDAGELEELF